MAKSTPDARATCVCVLMVIVAGILLVVLIAATAHSSDKPWAVWRLGMGAVVFLALVRHLTGPMRRSQDRRSRDAE
jgi:VIT1/CCC1 family predicted Fe2+/Mn2+ transporter